MSFYSEIPGSKQGICPKCGSENIDYGCAEIEGEGVAYPFFCEHCEFEGREWYNLVFAGIWEKE